MTKHEVTIIKWRDQGLLRPCPYCGGEMLPTLNESKPRYSKRTHCGRPECKAQHHLLKSRQLKEYYKKIGKTYDF